MYYIGIDGGGTKTRGLLSTENGMVLSDVTLGPSNHQLIGIEETQAVLAELINTLCTNASIKTSELAFVYLGLSGADIESDFELLNNCVHRIIPKTSFLVENDTWPILRSGLKKPYGVVSIYGTGANAAAIDAKGEKTILRALGYPLGGFGGGHDMALDAIQYAFRSEEGTYKASQLTQTLPLSLECNSMKDLLAKLYPENCLTQEQYNKIPPIVFSLAQSGDEVCIEILNRFGKIQGQMVSALIKKGTFNATIPIVLGGSIHEANGHYFTNAFKNEIFEITQAVDFILPAYPPVAGSLMMALDTASQHSDVYVQLEQYFNEY